MPTTTTADNIFYFIFQSYFLVFHVQQAIHMKYQDLLSLKNKNKIKILSAIILYGALKVNGLCV